MKKLINVLLVCIIMISCKNSKINLLEADCTNFLKSLTNDEIKINNFKIIDTISQIEFNDNKIDTILKLVDTSIFSRNIIDIDKKLIIEYSKKLKEDEVNSIINNKNYRDSINSAKKHSKNWNNQRDLIIEVEDINYRNKYLKMIYSLSMENLKLKSDSIYSIYCELTYSNKYGKHIDTLVYFNQNKKINKVCYNNYMYSCLSDVEICKLELKEKKLRLEDLQYPNQNDNNIQERINLMFQQIVKGLNKNENKK